MIEVNKQGEVWIFAEQHNGTLEEVSLELLARGGIGRHAQGVVGGGFAGQSSGR